MLPILLKYLFYFAILGIVFYIIRALLPAKRANPPLPPSNKEDEYWLDLEERSRQRAKKYNDQDFV